MRKLLAYAAIYFLWGASFLAIRQVVAVTPPFFAASFRFLCAGGILYAYSRWQGMPQPDKRQCISTAVLGLVMFAGDYGCLFWAEKEVPSGLAAVIAATIPVWVMLGEWLFAGSQRPTAKALAGIVLGIGGVILLMLPAGLHSSGFTLSALVLLFGCFLWAGGTVASRHLKLPMQLSMSSGLQMAWGAAFFSCSLPRPGNWACYRVLPIVGPGSLRSPWVISSYLPRLLPSPLTSGSSRGIQPPA